jgi:hypothetical protein
MHILNLKAAVSSGAFTSSNAVLTRELDEVLGNGQVEVNSLVVRPVTGTTLPVWKRILRSPDKGPKTVQEIASVLGVPDLAACILHYVKANGLNGFPESLEDFCRLTAERFKMLQIPVPVFQDPDSFINHNLRCTSAELFRGGTPRNDPVWVSVNEDITKTGDLGGRLPGYLRGLIKLREKRGSVSHRIAVIELLWPVNGGEADHCDTLIRVQRRVYKSAVKGLWATNIRSILGMAHLVPYGENRWLVNNRIDLKTWNDVYMGLGNAI